MNQHIDMATATKETSLDKAVSRQKNGQRSEKKRMSYFLGLFYTILANGINWESICLESSINHEIAQC